MRGFHPVSEPARFIIVEPESRVCKIYYRRAARFIIAELARFIIAEPARFIIFEPARFVIVEPDLPSSNARNLLRRASFANII